MIPAIDTYAWHRYGGFHYPDIESRPELQLTLIDMIGRAQSMGAKGIALESCFLPDFDPARLDDIRSALKETGLVPAWSSGHPRGLESGASEEGLNDILREIPVARSVGANVMRICAGGRGSRPERWEDHRAALLPMLVRAAEAAAGEGVVLAIENHLDLFADELAELVERVDSQALGVCFDTANNLRMGEDPVEVARKLIPHTRMTHVKDISPWPGGTSSFSAWPSVPLGRGQAQSATVLRMLMDAGYDGLLALEIDFLHPECGCADEDEALAIGLAELERMLIAATV